MPGDNGQYASIDPDGHIIEVGENITSVCQRFADSGMTPEQIAKRMDVPLEYVVACMQGKTERNG